MILHLGERVYWGAPAVIYLEGIITRLDEEAQTVLVHIDRATPNSAHLINTEVPFAADGLAPLQDESPEGITTEQSVHHLAADQMSDVGDGYVDLVFAGQTTEHLWEHELAGFLVEPRDPAGGHRNLRRIARCKARGPVQGANPGKPVRRPLC